MKQFLSILLGALTSTSLLAQSSPYGTGTVYNQILGNLSNGSVNFPSNSGFGAFSSFPAPSSILSNYTCDLFIPSAYDGSESFGLIVYIDSDDDGGIKNEWLNVLEEDNIIWVAPDNIGNSVDIDIRMGAAWAALLRMKELFNIDTNRIYVSGQSGGARMAQTLAYIYPEVITGSVPICGASFPLLVAQDYETQNPDSHYEVINSFSVADLNYIKSFDRRYAIMTSFDDFREGDIMNIYYNGFEQNNMNGKFLEISGGHCASSTQHFKNAISFVEHPDYIVLKDFFDNQLPLIGLDHSLKNAEITNNSLLMGSSNSLNDSVSFLKTKSGFDWNNRYGAIIRYDLKWNGLEKNPISVGLWGYVSDSMYCTNNGQSLTAENSVRLIFEDQNGLINCMLLSSNQIGVVDTLYKGVFTNWDGLSDIQCKWQIWDDELRIEFDNNLLSNSAISSNVRLLDDNRAIIVKWADLILGNGNYWGINDWDNGAYFTVSANTNNSNSVSFDNLMITSSSPGLIMSNLPELNLNVSNDTLITNLGFDNYDWFLNGVLIQTGVNSFVVNPVPGEYFVKGSIDNLCFEISNIFNYYPASLSEANDLNSFEIYPNPFTNRVYIVNKAAGESYMYAIVDIFGKPLIQGNLNESVSIDTSLLSNGIYFLKIKENSIKIVKE